MRRVWRDNIDEVGSPKSPPKPSFATVGLPQSPYSNGDVRAIGDTVDQWTVTAVIQAIPQGNLETPEGGTNAELSVTSRRSGHQFLNQK